MSRFSRIEFFEPYPSISRWETSIFAPKPLFFAEDDDDDLFYGLDLFKPGLDPYELFDTVTDLIQIKKTTPFCSSYKRIHRRVGSELYLQSLTDRVSALELSFDRLLKARTCGGDRKYTWTAEINSPAKNGFDRKYKWMAEIKEGKAKKKREEKVVEKNYKWTAEIKGKGDEAPILRTYTWKVSSGAAGECSGVVKEKKKEKCKKDLGRTRVVEIEEAADHGAVVLRQAFAKRVGAVKSKGKKKELSPQDAAIMIQMSFRAYLIRRSQALRALRELAVAKAKLKEIRVLFNNYRRRVTDDAEERQRISEKIIVLLIHVDDIEGADLMVRAAKRSIVDELEAMLEVVDPLPPGRTLSMRRRMFDMPSRVIQKELAEGVAQVVQMLDQEANGAAFEACL